MKTSASSEEGSPARAKTAILARVFGDAMRVGDGPTADKVMDDALALGMSPEVIHSEVIQPAMVRIGELWESGGITVADEHLATALAQRCLIRLFEELTVKRNGPVTRERILLAAVEGQRHVLGLRMIADILEGAGFDVFYLGEDIPSENLRVAIKLHEPAVVGLGFGMTGNISALADSLWVIHETAPDTRIMLGGRAVPLLLRIAGYPCVTSSMDAVSTVEALLETKPQPFPLAVDTLRSDPSRWPWPSDNDGAIADPVARRLGEAADGNAEMARVYVRQAQGYRSMALKDPLTGMANQQAFDDVLKALVTKGGTGSLLTIDVDYFGEASREHGEKSADELVKLVSEAIRRELRPGDEAARIRDGKFAVLMPETSTEAAAEVGQKVRESVAIVVNSAFTVSIGVAAIGDSV